MLKLFLCEQNGCLNFVVLAFKLFHHFVVIIPLRRKWLSEIRSPFFKLFRHFEIIIPLRTKWVSETGVVPFCSHFVILLYSIANKMGVWNLYPIYILAVTYTIYSLFNNSIFLQTVKIYFINKGFWGNLKSKHKIL